MEPGMGSRGIPPGTGCFRPDTTWAAPSSVPALPQTWSCQRLWESLCKGSQGLCKGQNTPLTPSHAEEEARGAQRALPKVTGAADSSVGAPALTRAPQGRSVYF